LVILTNKCRLTRVIIMRIVMHERRITTRMIQINNNQNHTTETNTTKERIIPPRLSSIPKKERENHTTETNTNINHSSAKQ